MKKNDDDEGKKGGMNDWSCWARRCWYLSFPPPDPFLHGTMRKQKQQRQPSIKSDDHDTVDI